MIVDVHYHLIPRMTQETAERLAKHAIRAAGIMGKELAHEAIKRKFLDTCGDPTGELLIASMEEAGIDLTVICRTLTAGGSGSGFS